jgi:hypothetical protein
VTDALNIVAIFAPALLAMFAMMVAVAAWSTARDAYRRVNELEALISRHRRAEANAAARGRPPEVG